MLLEYAKVLSNFSFNPSDTRQLQCLDVKNTLQTVFKRVFTVCTYSNCMTNQLLYCRQIFNQYLQQSKQNSNDFMNGLAIQCEKAGGS